MPEMSGIILSADIGTSSLKAAFIDFNRRVLAFSRMAYSPASHGAAEAWEEAFAETLKNLKANAAGYEVDAGNSVDAGYEVDAVCISGNGPTLVPIGPHSETLPPLYWHDTNVFPHEETKSLFLPRVSWFKNKSSAEYERVSFFVSSHEWLSSKLGAELFTALPSDSYEPYYWDDEQCSLLGVDRRKFPPFIKTGSVAGKVSAEAARSYGLKSGIPIIVGGPDFIMALIGSRTWKAGDVCDRAGSSEGVNFCASFPPAGSAVKGLRVLPHVIEGLWNIGALIPSSGRIFEQYRTSTGQSGRGYEEILAELIPSVKDTGLFKNITYNDPDSGRAALCAIGFSVRSALEKLSDSGFPVKEMTVSGGQGKNRRWNQLKADITGVSLKIPEIGDSELAGNTVFSALALGEASSMEEAADRIIRFREVYEPCNSSFWKERYTQYEAERKTGNEK